MLWGAAGSSTFLSDVQSQIKAGANITYVIGFNEPDGDSSTYVPMNDLFLSGIDIRSQDVSRTLKASFNPITLS